MKKCKYHCDYGDGENCHYTGESGCVDREKRKNRTPIAWAGEITTQEAIEKLKADGWTECTYNGSTFALVKNRL